MVVLCEPSLQSTINSTPTRSLRVVEVNCDARNQTYPSAQKYQISAKFKG